MTITRVIDGICRAEGARVLSGLIGRFRDFDLAEDAMQDAFTKALEVWPAQGLPKVPAAWLATVARRRALDLLRRRRTGPVYTGEPPDLAAPAADDDDHEPDPADHSGVADDRLRLLFTCCHPAIGQAAQMALALRTLCGLSTREIARAFLEPEATTAQRLVRVKKKIVDAGIPYEVPSREALPERLRTVLGVAYLVFNEGYATTEHDGLIRPDLSSEAIRLARLVALLMPDEPEALGLLALMLHAQARRRARRDAQGGYVPLAEQDPARWDTRLIDEAEALLLRASGLGVIGRYQLEAAVQSAHVIRRRTGHADWPAIVQLYDALAALTGSPVVEINRAVAVAETRGAAAGLAVLDGVAGDARLADYQPYWAARAGLLARIGAVAEADAAYALAIGLEADPAVRRFLQQRRDGLAGRAR